jgi:hypothetical protein
MKQINRGAPFLFPLPSLMPRSFCVIILTLISLTTLLSAHAQSLDLYRNGDRKLTGHGRFDVRGQYGEIPAQPTVTERDYEWWVPGKVGFWQYHLEGGFQAAFGDRITTRFTLTARSDDADRDFVGWGNEVSVKARLKEASIRLERFGFDQLALVGGRQQVDYPLLTVYDYVGGRLIWRITPHLTADWGQWQVFEGRNIDRPGKSSDDIDLWGPQLYWQTASVRSRLYALINSKAGGSDGIGSNVKMVGVSSSMTWHRLTRAEWTGVIQHGDISTPVTGQRQIRAWAIRGRFKVRISGHLSIGGAYWAGSGDQPGTPGIDEGFQQFGYRNTLEKSTFFYRPGLRNLRRSAIRLEGHLTRLTGRIHLARVGERTPARTLGTEIGWTLDYAYSKYAHLKWRWGVTADGQRMQIFELSSTLGD